MAVTKLKCRCGQSFSVALINGLRRTSCPFCKASVNESCIEVPAEIEAEQVETGVATPCAARVEQPSVVTTGIDPCTALLAATSISLLSGYSIMIYLQFTGMLGRYRVILGLLGVFVTFPLMVVYFLTRTLDACSALWATPCIRCGGRRVVEQVWTLWGGYILTRVFAHVRCFDCGCGYNGRLRVSNYPYAILCGVAVRIAITMAMIGAAIAALVYLHS